MCELSVIIPVYNTKPVLPRCVDSILGQSFTDFELLLVDDGSTDGSGAVCDDYAANDSRVRVFHKEWGGTSSARNLGLDNATGEWVTFIDSDDFIENGYLTLPFADDMGFYMRNWCLANGQHVERFGPQVVDGSCYWDFLREQLHSFAFRTVWGFFFKREVVVGNGIRFDERFHVGEDSLFMLDHLMQCTTLQTVDGPAYRYDRYEHWEAKHTLTGDEAEAYLSAFMDKYERLPVEVPRLAFQMFGLFRALIDRNERKTGRKWLGVKPVRRMIQSQLAHGHILAALRYVAKIMLQTTKTNIHANGN